MSFDRFLLTVESRDLSQADTSIIRVSSFSILQKFNFWMIKFGTWQFGKIDVLANFIIQKFATLKSLHFSQFFWWEVNLRVLRAFILQRVQASVVERQKKKLCYPSLSFAKEDALIVLLSAWDRSRTSTWLNSQKKLVKGHIEDPRLSSEWDVCGIGVFYAICPSAPLRW